MPGGVQMITEEAAMRCPYCRHADSRVVDSREADDGQLIRRRRSCPECGKRFTTVEEAVLAIVKRSGVTEPFSRTKIIGGVRKACQGRPVDEDKIALLAQRVRHGVRMPFHLVARALEHALGVATADQGVAVLKPQCLVNIFTGGAFPNQATVGSDFSNDLIRLVGDQDISIL